MSRFFSSKQLLSMIVLVSLIVTRSMVAADLPTTPTLPTLVAPDQTKTPTVEPVPTPTVPVETISTDDKEVETPTVQQSLSVEQETPTPTADQEVLTPTISVEPTPVPKALPIEDIPSQDSSQPVITPSPAPVKPVLEEGLDTIDIEDGGNWLLKRKALEDTADTIEKIVNDFSKILEASTTYKIKRNKLDTDYDLYIATVGFNLGDLDQVLTNLMDDLEKERKEEGSLSAQERSTLDEIKEKQNEIKQLQEDLKALAALDEEIDKVVDTVDSQIKTASNYQNQAWKNFQEIKKVLSDEKAEELYYRTVSLQKNMQEIYAYLTTALSSYFLNQIDAMRSKMDSIKNRIQVLQTKGVDLQKAIEQFEQADEQREKVREQEEIDEAVEKALQEARKKRQETSWWHSLTNAFYWPFAQVAKLWNYTTSSIMNLFTTKPTKKPDVVPESVLETPTPKRELPTGGDK